MNTILNILEKSTYKRYLHTQKCITKLNYYYEVNNLFGPLNNSFGTFWHRWHQVFQNWIWYSVPLWRAVFNYFILEGFLSPIFLFKQSHKCSIGLRSGLWGAYHVFWIITTTSGRATTSWFSKLACGHHLV